MMLADKCLRKYFFNSLNKNILANKTPSSIVKEKLMTNEIFCNQILSKRITVSGLINSSPYLLLLNTLLRNLNSLENALKVKQGYQTQINESNQNTSNEELSLNSTSAQERELSVDSLWNNYLSQFEINKEINENFTNQKENTGEEKISYMKDLLNQKYDIVSAELIYEMILFGIENNLSTGINHI